MPELRHFTIGYGYTGALVPATTSGLIIAGRGCITSVSANNTGASAELVQLWDGQSDNGVLLWEAEAPANGSVAPASWVPHALHFERGLWLVLGADTVQGSVAGWVDHDCRWWLQCAHEANEAMIALAAAQLGAAG